MNDNKATNFGRWKLGFANYRCLGKDVQYIDSIERVNVIVGKNNSGKTTLIDFLQSVIGGVNPLRSPSNEVVHGILSTTISSDDRQLVQGQLQTIHHGPHHHSQISNATIFNSYLLGGEVHMRMAPNVWTIDSITPGSSDVSQVWIPQAQRLGHELAVAIGKPFRACRVVRVASERNIVAEEARGSFSGQLIEPNGSGLTAFLEHIDSRGSDNLRSKLDRLLVPAINELVDEIDRISRFNLRRDSKNPDLFEIVLTREVDEADLRLSECGTGFKTLIQILTSMLLVPDEMSKFDKCDTTFFLFEELENSMHPSTLRKLLRFIHSHAITNNSYIFLTTHSSVTIDTFSSDKQSQLLHVIRSKNVSLVTKVEGWLGSSRVLDDIGARASDLLQSNCIVWLEGPSDIIYLKRWIELWTDNCVKNNSHYQCLMYGGQTGDYHTLSDSLTDELVACLKVNRNVVFCGDSDRTSPAEDENKRCRRIRQEIEGSGRGVCWVTDGRETENYIPAEILNALCKTRVEVDKFTDVPELMGKHYAPKRKVPLALATLDHWKLEHIRSDLHLQTMLSQVVSFICACNDITNEWHHASR